jgi:hypothetical protein
MITIKETTNKSLTIKDAYMDSKTLVDDDGAEIDIYDLLQKTYGDGVQFTIKVSTKVDRDLNE